MRTLIMAAIAALAFSTVADAKTCKDAAGKFIKCPAPAAAPAKPAQCKDAKGKFVKCPTVTGTATTTTTTTKVATNGKTSTSSKTTKAPTCKNGVACGNSCIPKGAVCHK